MYTCISRRQGIKINGRHIIGLFSWTLAEDNAKHRIPLPTAAINSAASLTVSSSSFAFRGMRIQLAGPIAVFKKNMRSEILTMTNVKTTVFWDMTPCSYVPNHSVSHHRRQ
jgi:hypothetical protein